MQQLVRETGSNYNTFISDITEKVGEMMGDDYSARIIKVMKNNSLELDSLVLLKEGKNFAPNIYLQPYYDSYLEGNSIQSLAERLCNVYQNNSHSKMATSFQYTFEEMKSNVIYRLVNFEKNKKLLANVPHIRYLDLAVTFHCLVHNDGDGIGTIRITNDHVELWETSVQELHALAVKNTTGRFPAVIRSMDEVIRGMLTDELEDNELPQELLQELYSQGAGVGHKMYVLSNQKGINGATCMLYENVLKRFADKLQTDLFILPSSIHEVLLVPYSNSLSKEILSQMVRDVNFTQVAVDEVLSDKVYFFSRNENAIIL